MLEMRKREKNKLQTEQIIAQTAIDLFLEKGLHETAVAEIMKEAGLGTGTFYNYFTSKEEIIKYCLAKRIDLVIQTCETVQQYDLNTTEKLIQILEVVGNTYDENRQLVDLYLKYYHSSDKISKEPPHGERFVEVIAKIVLQGQKEDEFRKDLPAEVIVEMFTGILKTTMSSNLELTFIENINYKYSILVEGIVKK